MLRKLVLRLKFLRQRSHTDSGMCRAYTFFAVFCLLSLIWTFYFVPETRGSEWHAKFVFLSNNLTLPLGTLEAMDQYVLLNSLPSLEQ